MSKKLQKMRILLLKKRKNTLKRAMAHFWFFSAIFELFWSFLIFLCSFCWKKCKKFAERGGGDGRAYKILRGGGLNFEVEGGLNFG